MLDRPLQPAPLPFLLLGIVVRFAIATLLLPGPAAASGLLAPAAGSADAAMGGSTIAEPLSPLGSAFSNPAGFAAFEQASMGSGLGVAYGRGVVHGDNPPGYHAENEVLVPFHEFFLTIPYERWTFGVASIGTSGARFDYGARPSLGVNDGFFSESGILGFPIAASFRVSERLWLGGEIAPLYGTTHLRFSREVAEAPGSPTPFRFTVSGMGVQGMIGATWKIDDAWTVGGSVKPPGKIWTNGDSKFGAGKQDVDLDLDTPLEIALGASRTIATKWKASYGFRFVDTSTLAKSFLRYEKTPSADSPFLPGARDEWRHALGLSYTWSDAVTLLSGVSKANGIVSSKGISPMSYDSKDWRLSSGLRWKGERWSIDSAFAYIFAGRRHVTASDAMVFPGQYDSKPAYLLSIVITRKF